LHFALFFGKNEIKQKTGPHPSSPHI